ncbi:hypothetical protein F2Q70_00015122 [Brassica cretica]|uniref:Hexosyltransferase n=1 Tax=Brassica cretica TaxID=69181 RepID=A0A8S9I4S5_BRACR|nr:hypothetical protein F2Q70_00015122 [Brassica cretica]
MGRSWQGRGRGRDMEYDKGGDNIGGASLKKIETEKGVIARFVIGRSANKGDSMDKSIDAENSQTDDFIILDNVVEAPEEASKKVKLFFAYAADRWDAQFYAKANDNIYVNMDALGSTLAAHLGKPRAYIGCMKSGEVFSEPNQKWYEPEWWKFGDKKAYFRHAYGEMYVITNALARFVSINRRVGSKKMGFQERTPLMVAAMYGSFGVLTYIISTGRSDVNRVSSDEKVTAHHCAVSACFVSIVEVIKILLDASTL